MPVHRDRTLLPGITADPVPPVVITGSLALILPGLCLFGLPGTEADTIAAHIEVRIQRIVREVDVGGGEGAIARIVQNAQGLQGLLPHRGVPAGFVNSVVDEPGPGLAHPQVFHGSRDLQERLGELRAVVVRL